MKHFKDTNFNNKNKKRTFEISSLSLTALGLSACGGGSSETSDADRNIGISNKNVQISSYELESNGTLETANLITSGSFGGQLSSYGDQDLFYFGSQLETHAVQLIPPFGVSTYSHQISLLDRAGNILSNKQIFDNGFIHAKTDGSFYIKVHSSDNTGSYQVGIYRSLASYEDEPNNSFATATELNNAQTVSGQISSTADVDFYKFTAGQSVVSINLLKNSFVDVNGENAVASGGWPYGDHTLTVYNESGSIVARFETLYAFPAGDTFQVATVPNQNYYITIDDDDASVAGNGVNMVLDADYSLTVTGATASAEPIVTVGVITNETDIDVFDLLGKGSSVTFASEDTINSHEIEFRTANGESVLTQEISANATFDLEDISAEQGVDVRYMYVSSTDDFSDYMISFTDI